MSNFAARFFVSAGPFIESGVLFRFSLNHPNRLAAPPQPSFFGPAAHPHRGRSPYLATAPLPFVVVVFIINALPVRAESRQNSQFEQWRCREQT